VLNPRTVHREGGCKDLVFNLRKICIVFGILILIEKKRRSWSYWLLGRCGLIDEIIEAPRLSGSQKTREYFGVFTRRA